NKIDGAVELVPRRYVRAYTGSCQSNPSSYVYGPKKVGVREPCTGISHPYGAKACRSSVEGVVSVHVDGISAQCTYQNTRTNIATTSRPVNSSSASRDNRSRSITVQC